MYVKNYMSSNPITIGKNEKIAVAVELFEKNGYHRLPVVDGGNHLIGLLTESVLGANTPSNATSLSIHELNYLLSKTTVEAIMIKNVITIGPDDLLEKAADLMRRFRIGCLPVVDSRNYVLGIITQKDILGAFNHLLGYYDAGSRVVIDVEYDKPGILESFSTILAKENINITNMVVYHVDGVKIVVRTDEVDGDKVAKLLTDAGFKVSDISTNVA